MKNINRYFLVAYHPINGDFLVISYDDHRKVNAFREPEWEKVASRLYFHSESGYLASSTFQSNNSPKEAVTQFAQDMFRYVYPMGEESSAAAWAWDHKSTFASFLYDTDKGYAVKGSFPTSSDGTPWIVGAIYIFVVDIGVKAYRILTPNRNPYTDDFAFECIQHIAHQVYHADPNALVLLDNSKTLRGTKVVSCLDDGGRWYVAADKAVFEMANYVYEKFLSGLTDGKSDNPKVIDATDMIPAGESISNEDLIKMVKGS